MFNSHIYPINSMILCMNIWFNVAAFFGMKENLLNGKTLRFVL